MTDNAQNHITILGVETSCDDTCASLARATPIHGLEIKSASDLAKINFKILSNIISSQVKLHKKYGGVFPSLAKREHQKNLPAVISQAIKKSKIKTKKQKESKEDLNRKIEDLKILFGREDDFFKTALKFLKNSARPQIDLLALTIGPGLEPSLWQGINFTRAMAMWWDIPIVPVNHIEGHILANFIDQKDKNNDDELFPAVCLVVSGGHTQLILMEGIGRYKTLGESRDDAAGECLDKTARILGLDYPGGPAIAKLAEELKHQKDELKIKLPRPMMFTKDYDFSFSGLKTATLYSFKKQPADIQRSKNYIRAMAFEIQEAVIDILVYKTLKAARNFQARSIIAGGGVTANQKLKERFQSEIAKLYTQPRFLAPDKIFSTDNASMIAMAAFFNLDKQTDWKEIQANANLRIK